MRVVLGLACVALVTLGFAFFHPRSPLPPAWNPWAPFEVAHPLTPLTNMKLQDALRDPKLCFAALEKAAGFVRMPDLEASPDCHIRDRLELRSVVGLSLQPFETRCQTALRLTMWAEHGIKPAALLHLGTDAREILHASSYNCRRMRTPGGTSRRISTHASADAVDITGIVTTDGDRVTLLAGWTAEDGRADMFRDMRNSACRWFRVTLGPDYNALHADHFHLQHTGYGLCR